MKNIRFIKTASVIIGLFTIVVYFLGNHFYSKGKFNLAKAKIESLREGLKEFKKRCGYYPKTLEALRTDKCYGVGSEPWKDTYLFDIWDTKYLYNLDSDGYLLISLGEDKLEGGKGFKMDLKASENIINFESYNP